MTDINRRQLLGASAAAALIPSVSRAADAGRIDVHHHFIPPVYLKRAAPELLRFVDTDHTAITSWTPETSLAQMDKFGVDTAFVCTPPVWFGKAAAARSLSRECNEAGARLMGDHKGRFGHFAALPLPDQDGSLKEIAYLFDTLHADGVCLLTSYDGKWLGDKKFAPVMDELNRRHAVVFVHPTAPDCCSHTVPDISLTTVEFLFDSTRALLSLMVSGTLKRCPNISFIFSHTGGVTSVLATRISQYFGRHPELAARLPASPLETFKLQHYDVANSMNPATFDAALDFVGPGQLLFGTDNPFVPVVATSTAFSKYPMPAERQAMIGRENALKLFPRLG